LLEEGRANLLAAGSVPRRQRTRDSAETRPVRDRTGRDAQKCSLAQIRYAQRSEDPVDGSEEDGLATEGVVQMASDAQTEDRSNQILAVPGHAAGSRFRKLIRLDPEGW